MDILLKIVSLIITQNASGNDDLCRLYRVLKLEDFIKVVSIFDGRTVKFFSKDEIDEALVLALCYYYKEIEGKSWDQIRELIPFEISSISFGVKIKNLNSFLRAQIDGLFKKLDEGEASNGRSDQE